jgi:hypothetical protein
MGDDKAENTLRVVLNGLQPYQCASLTAKIFICLTFNLLPTF